MAAIPPPQIQYYLKETTNQILVSGSSPINTQLNAIKDPTTVFNGNYTSKISSLGENISYVVQNGVEFTNLILNQNLPFTQPTTDATNTASITKNGSLNGTNAVLFLKSVGLVINQVKVTSIGSGFQVGETITFTQSELLAVGFTNVSSGIVITLTENQIVGSSTLIPLRNDQELWVYRGYDINGGDGNTSRYNPHLHRPYKAYIVTETGSGKPTNPFLPEGDNVYTQVVDSNVNINNVFLEGTLNKLGNGVLNGVTQTNEQVSGSFVVHHEEMQVLPWVFTQYTGISSSPPSTGALFRIYLENADDFSNEYSFKTPYSPPILPSNIAYNNSTITDVTEIYVGDQTLLYPTLTTLSGSVENFDKNGGKIRITQQSNILNNVTFNITGLETSTSGFGSYITLTVSNPSPSAGYSNLPNNEDIDINLSEYSELVNTLFQEQGTILNTQPEVDNRRLKNGDYTYTSSFFSTSGTTFNANDAFGTSQFGLCTNYGYFVKYKISYDNASVGEETINVNFSSSTNDLVPNTFTLTEGFSTGIRALVGSISTTGFTYPSGTSQNSDGTYISPQLNITIENNNSNRDNITPPNFFATKWSDAYISFSQSLSSSIDGLYVFNQLPQNDVQVTASMFLTAWTGSDAATAAKYATAIYDADVYGEGETGDGPTWPTASIRLYTGSYPFAIPTTANDFVTESQFKNDSIHLGGYAITMSYLIPSQSLNVTDCLSLSLQVSSGSADSSSVQNSLVVQHYQLEFNTPPGLQTGDGLVPTFIENAFSGSDGFNNVPDCQPFLNNVITERENKEIQIVNYSTDAYTPVNFYPILSGSAQKSTVPASNYTQLASINPRYDGSRSSTAQLNIWNAGDIGTYGKKPNVELKDAFFGYFNDLDDPYPNINGLTRVNLSYLIDEEGNALPPTIEDQLSIDTFSSVFPNTSLGKIAVRDITSKYQDLGSPSYINRLMEYVTPICYSQTSGNNYSTSIPLSGSGNISRYDNGDGNDVTFAQFSVAGTASYDTSQVRTNISYWLNPSEVISQPAGTDILPYLENLSGPAFTRYPSGADWGSAGSDLNNQQLVSIQTSLVTSFVSSTLNVGKELKMQLDMLYGNIGGGAGTKTNRRFNLEYINCKVYTTSGQVYLIKNVDQYGWFHYMNVNNPQNLGPAYSPNQNRFTTSRIPVPSEGLKVGIDFQMNETLFNLGLVSERSPRDGGGVLALEWIFSANSGPQSIKSGNELTWRMRGSFLYRRGGYQQGYFFPIGYTGAYTPTKIQGMGVQDHLLAEANKANAPFWSFPGSDYSIIEMQSPNFNEAYGTGFTQGYLPYQPGPSQYFPGNIEPSTTSFDPITNALEIQEDDEIRFGNNENFSFKILEVFAPQENNGKVKLQLDKDVDTSINKDFFLVRRRVVNPNSLYLDTPFPYGILSSGSISQAIFNTGSQAISGSFTPGLDGEGNYTGSVSNLELATTPGILFPDFPTDYLIESASIIVNDLITRRIIQS